MYCNCVRKIKNKTSRKLCQECEKLLHTMQILNEIFNFLCICLICRILLKLDVWQMRDIIYHILHNCRPRFIPFIISAIYIICNIYIILNLRINRAKYIKRRRR